MRVRRIMAIIAAAMASVGRPSNSEPRTPNSELRTPNLWIVVLTLALASACSEAPKTYVEEVAAWRAEKDTAFKGEDDSPIPEAQRAAFTGLRYYDIDPRFRVPAALSESTMSSQVIEMDTTAGNRERMRVIGTLEFTLNGQKQALTAFVQESAPDTRRLFVPFGDATNRGETYGGGRYLDLSRSSTGLYDLDFNRAYNPFCVYDVRYECPLPPRENRLPIEIKAGEKMPAGKSAS